MFRRLFVLAILLFASVHAEDWALEVPEDGTASVLYRKTEVITSQYLFWKTGWKWTWIDLKAGQWEGDMLPLDGGVGSLGIDIKGEVTRVSGGLEYSYEISADKDIPDIIGGCLEFKFHLDEPVFEKRPPDPTLLPDHTGWEWNVANGDAVKLEATSPFPLVTFKHGSKTVIRVFLIKDELEKGTKRITFTITIPGGEEIALAPYQEFGEPEIKDWKPDLVSSSRSPIDLSYLNHKPAGSLGPIRTQGEDLVFRDGTEARFWGTNLAAYALFVDEAKIKEHAKRIAQLGFNLVRIHHHDTTPWVRPTVIDLDRSDTQHLWEKGLGPLKAWIEALKAEGVYIWLDLHVGRALKQGDAEGVIGDKASLTWEEVKGSREMPRPDVPTVKVNGKPSKLEGYHEIAKKEGIFKGFNYYNEGVEELMVAFNRKYLDYFKDDPAVITLLVTNENDLLKHFQSPMLNADRYPYHHLLFLDAVKKFSTESGISRMQLRRTWEPGPGRIFLINQEGQFYIRMVQTLRDLGLTTPIAVSSVWGGLGLEVLPSLSVGDLIDIHTYAHPQSLGTNPLYSTNFGIDAASFSVAGKPTTISEWGVENEVIGRAVVPLYMMGLGSLQGWRALMHYNYSQTTFWEGGAPDTWSSYLDPAIISLMPAAAIAYRQGHVAPAEKTYFLPLTEQNLMSMRLSPKYSKSLRTLAEQSAIRIGLPAIKILPWLERTPRPSGAIVIDELDQNFLSENATSVTSDTGELTRNWEKSLYTIKTPKTLAVEGILEGKTIALDGLKVAVDLPIGVVVVTSLDEEPIHDSTKMLLTVVGRAAVEEKKLPYRSELATGTITIETMPNLKVYPLSPDGTKGTPLDAPYDNGAYTITLTGNEDTLWYLISE